MKWIDKILDFFRGSDRAYQALLAENAQLKAQILDLTSSLEASQAQHLSLSKVLGRVQHTLRNHTVPTGKDNHQGICG